MPTYQELKDAVYDVTPVSKMRSRSAERDAETHKRQQFLNWRAHKAQVVTGLVQQAPQFDHGCPYVGDPLRIPIAPPSDLDYSDVAINHEASAYSILGGPCILLGMNRAGMQATPYAVSVSATVFEADWVMAMHRGKVIAMSVDEAFRRGLKEVELT